jgi:translocation and assembly module TamB
MVLPVAVGLWIVFTESGLRFVTNHLNGLTKDVHIAVSGVSGSFAAGLQIDHLQIDVDPVVIEMDYVRGRLRPEALLVQTVKVVGLSAARTQVLVHRRTRPPAGRALVFLPRFLKVISDTASISNVTVLLPNGHRLEARNVSARVDLRSRQLALNHLKVDSDFFTLEGAVKLGAANPLSAAGTLDWTLSLQRGHLPWRGSATLVGDLNELRIEAAQTTPVRAALVGRALDLTDRWHWDARLQSASIDLAALALAPLLMRDVNLSFSGNAAGLSAQGTLNPVTLASGPLQVTARGPYPDQRVRLDALRVNALGGTRLDAEGSFDFAADPGGAHSSGPPARGPAIELHGTVSDFHWPLQSALPPNAHEVRIPSARFTLAGAHLPYRYSFDGGLKLPQLPTINALAAGALALDTLTIDQGTAHWLNGSLTAEGGVRWNHGELWNLTLSGENLNPRDADPRWPGNLALALKASGAGFGDRDDLELTLTRVDGTLRNQPLHAAGHVARHGAEYVIDNVAVQFGDAHLNAGGMVGPAENLRVSLAAKNLDKLVPGAAGAIDLKAEISGPAASARCAAKISAQSLRYSDYQAKHLQLNLDVDLADRLASQMDLIADGVTLRDYSLGNLTAALTGRASAHHVTLKSSGGIVALDAALDGAYQPKIWRATLTQLNLHDAQRLALNLAAPTQAKVSLDQVEVGPLCLRHDSEHICAHGNWNHTGAWNLLADANQLPLDELGALMASHNVYAGSLGLDLKLHAGSDAIVTGDVIVDLRDGHLTYKTPSGRDNNLSLGSGRAQLHATAQQLTADLKIQDSDQISVNADLVGVRQLSTALLDTPVKGTLNANTRELGWMPLVVPPIDHMVGLLTADLQVSGTLRSPQLDGTLAITEGALDIYQVNLLMRGLVAQVDIAGSNLKISGQSSVGDGKARIAGDLQWSARSLQGTVKLSGDKLRLVDIPEMRVDASPDLTFKIQGRRIDIGGSVTIPFARLKPADLTGAVLPSGDEIIVSEIRPADDQNLAIYTNVHLSLGKDVSVETYGLRGRLTGEVDVSANPDGETHATGELNIDEGKYTAYGRLLDIQRGRLIFSGGLVDDPAVDLRAVKVFPDVTAGVNVRGRLRNPQVSFFSDPSLTQSQIVSLLVAGGNLESLQKNGTQPAGGELLMQGGAIVAQQIGARIGVDDVGVETDTLNQTSLVLGKFLNPRLYVSYGVSLTEALNTLKLRYTLGDGWTVKLEAGQQIRGTDLVYTIER